MANIDQKDKIFSEKLKKRKNIQMNEQDHDLHEKYGTKANQSEVNERD
jgi:hypothetical protein